jgi:hypothetical protein
MDHEPLASLVRLFTLDDRPVKVRLPHHESVRPEEESRRYLALMVKVSAARVGTASLET